MGQHDGPGRGVGEPRRAVVEPQPDLCTQPYVPESRRPSHTRQRVLAARHAPISGGARAAGSPARPCGRAGLRAPWCCPPPPGSRPLLRGRPRADAEPIAATVAASGGSATATAWPRPSQSQSLPLPGSSSWGAVNSTSRAPQRYRRYRVPYVSRTVPVYLAVEDYATSRTTVHVLYTRTRRRGKGSCTR